MSTDTRTTKLNFAPTILRETTQYEAEGSWYSADKVRFRAGKPQNIRGWQKELILLSWEHLEIYMYGEPWMVNGTPPGVPSLRFKSIMAAQSTILLLYPFQSQLQPGILQQV